MRLFRGLLLKSTLNLLNWILKRNKGNSLIIGGPLGWNWQATLDTTHHGSLAGPANAHRHSDLANIGIDDHHARDHATRHAVGGGDQVSLDTSQIGTGRFGMARMPDGTSGQVLTAQGAGVDPAYAAAAGVTVAEDVIASANLRNSNDTAKSTSSPSPTFVKIKEVKLNAALRLCRIKFDLRVTTGAGENTARARIYKNGVGIGTIQTNTTTTYVTKSEDFTLNGVADDLIQIYGCKISGDSAACQVRYMRFYYNPDDYITHIGGYELVTPLALTPVRDPTISMTNQDP